MSPLCTPSGLIMMKLSSSRAREPEGPSARADGAKPAAGGMEASNTHKHTQRACRQASGDAAAVSGMTAVAECSATGPPGVEGLCVLHASSRCCLRYLEDLASKSLSSYVCLTQSMEGTQPTLPRGCQAHHSQACSSTLTAHSVVQCPLLCVRT